MTMLYYVKSLVSHHDETAEGRPLRPKGSIYKLPYDSAMRKQRVGHAEMIGPVETTDLSEVLNDNAYHPDMEGRVPEGPTETKEESPKVLDPEDLIEQRSNSPWYDIEGYDDNPVNGYDSAVEAAREVIDN